MYYVKKRIIAYKTVKVSKSYKEYFKLLTILNTFYTINQINWFRF